MPSGLSRCAAISLWLKPTIFDISLGARISCQTLQLPCQRRYRSLSVRPISGRAMSSATGIVTACV